MSKVASMGPRKYQREQSHAFGKLSSNNEVAAGGFVVVWVNMTQSHVK